MKIINGVKIDYFGEQENNQVAYDIDTLEYSLVIGKRRVYDSIVSDCLTTEAEKALNDGLAIIEARKRYTRDLNGAI